MRNFETCLRPFPQLLDSPPVLLILKLCSGPAVRQPAFYRLRLIKGGEYGKQEQFIEPAEFAGTPFLRALKPFFVPPVLTALISQRFAVPSFHFALPFPGSQVWPQGAERGSHRNASHAFRQTSGQEPQAGDRHRTQQGAPERREGSIPAQAVEITIGPCSS